MENGNPKKKEPETSGQKKLKNAVSSGDAEKSNLNQNHNTKKTTQGPNTDR